MADTSDAHDKSKTSATSKTAAEKADLKTEIPPAGPHADPKLTDETATPGTGALPSTEDHIQKDVDGGVG